MPMLDRKARNNPANFADTAEMVVNAQKPAGPVRDYSSHAVNPPVPPAPVSNLKGGPGKKP